MAFVKDHLQKLKIQLQVRLYLSDCSLRAPKTQIFVEEHTPRVHRSTTLQTAFSHAKLEIRNLSSQKMKGQTGHAQQMLL